MKLKSNKTLNKSSNVLSRIKSLFKRIFFIIGLITVTLFVLIILNNKLYYSSKISGIENRINAQLSDENIRISSVEDSYGFLTGAIKGAFRKSDFPKINISTSHNNVLNLNDQIKNNKTRYVKAELDIFFNDETKKLSGKIRKKGDRRLHFEDFDSMSYRVNLSGDDVFLGMEEFSIQKPIIRNYSWEYLANNVIKNEKILALKQGPIFLSFNGDNRGLYSYEEVPSKITLERQRRKDGPIFGLDEELGTTLPDVVFDVYDQTSWVNNSIYNYSLSVLNKFILLLKNNDLTKINNMLYESFDIEKWAKYFALIDIFGTYHGSIPKSVKFYFNPVTGKFEPLAFDLHYGAGKFDNFILLDLIMFEDDANCIWLCEHSNFYLSFLNNEAFLKYYLKFLDDYATDSFFNKINSIYDERFKYVDNEFYSRLMPSDSIFYRGFLPYFFKIELINKRIGLIKKRMNLFQNSGAYSEIRTQNFLDTDRESINIPLYDTDAKIIKKINYNFKGRELVFKEPTLVILEGYSLIEGLSKDDPLIISGPVTFIQNDGEFVAKNIVFDQNKIVNIRNRNISGILNLISVNATLSGVTFRNNLSEDAINLITSKFIIESVSFENIHSDALDSDFSDGEINNLYCSLIANDCLDASDSNITISNLNSNNIGDKSVSAGENSNVKITNFSVSDSEIGLVSKDGSRLEVLNATFEKTKLYGAAYMKKEEYAFPSIKVEKIITDGESSNFLIGEKINASFERDFLSIDLYSSNEIFQMLYGNEYGAKTAK